MKIDFKDSRNGRAAVLINDVIRFETYGLTRGQWITLRDLIQRINEESFKEGFQTCQQAHGLIDAINKSKASTGADQQPQSASIPPGNHCVLAENLSIAPVGVADERKDPRP